MPDTTAELTIRTAAPDEIDTYARVFSASFGQEPDERHTARVRALTDPARTLLGLSARGEVVATASAYRFDLPLPGGAELACAGVTRVSVRTDHRRRGVLTRLMAALHGHARDHDEPVAALWPSEQVIYGRFGYGEAVPTIDIEVDRARSRLIVDASVREVELVDRTTARRAFPAIRDAVRRVRPGLLSRSAVWWDAVLDDDPREDRDGASPRTHALIPDRGYALYRIHPHWRDGRPDAKVVVDELHAVDAAAAAALWAFVTDVDLSTRTLAVRRPSDDAVLHLLAEPDMARITQRWPMMVRILDVPRVLAARRYATDGQLVLAIHDGFGHGPDALPSRLRLTVEDGDVEVARTDARAELTMDVRELASVLLGGHRTTVLHSAGLIEADDPACARRLDAMLLSPLAPWQDGVF